MTTTLDHENEIKFDGSIDWQMVLAHVLAIHCPCGSEDDVDWFIALMEEILDLFDGDEAEAVEAVRTGTLAFRFADGEWWIRHNYGQDTNQKGGPPMNNKITSSQLFSATEFRQAQE